VLIFWSPNFYTKLNVAQNNETNLTKQVEYYCISSLRRRHAATKTTTTMITAAWTKTLQALSQLSQQFQPAQTESQWSREKEEDLDDVGA